MAQSHTQAKERLKRWFKRLLRSNLVGVMVGLLALPLYQLVFGHPSPSTITHLMDQEIQAAKTHDQTLVMQIYAPEAVVTDAGCYSNQSHVAHGLTEITARYRQLPPFVSLDHINIAVTWTPDTRWATKATATAETVGVLVTTNNGSQTNQYIVGREQWVFAQINGQWLISSFTYNQCLPS